MERVEKNKGITLIALIVTIIILIILAGISIKTLTGNNSLIKNARKSLQLHLVIGVLVMYGLH